MKYTACFMMAASSFFCTALWAQGSSPQTLPDPVSPVVPVPYGGVGLPVPVSPPVNPPVPVSPLPPVSAPLAPTRALPSGPLSRAEVAATSWLAVVDAGDYASSWHQGAGLLQISVSQPTWESALKTGRQPLGRAKSRLLKSATFSRTLTGAPDGEYLLIQYETQFEFRPQAIETLTIMKDKDTLWRTAGYFIK